MAEYSRAELERLQAEAAARIREMQARAQPAPKPAEEGMPPMPSFVRIPHEQQPERGQAGSRSGGNRQDTARRSAGPPPGPKAAPSHEKRPVPLPVPPAQSPARPRQTGLDLMQMLNFKNIDLDSDRTLILLIILLLSGEENDSRLMLALLYLLL